MNSAAMRSSARLILVRHGESEGNRDRTFTQNADVGLTVRGCAQAVAAGQCIRGRVAPTRIVASPYARARRTAEIIGEILGVAVECDDAFCEQSFGVFAGQPYEALLGDAAYHEGPRWEWRPAGGESLTDVAARVTPRFEELARSSAG